MKKLIILSIILLAANALQGRIIRIPADRTTIQKGIDAAKAGDTVLVSPGTYVENINYKGKNITVASLFLTTRDTSYISRTIINGNKSGSVVTISNGEKATAILAGFIITNGSSSHGGGIYCNNSSPTIENVVSTGNSVYWDGWDYGSGGGIYFRNSKSRLKNVIITDNTASDAQGGGIYCAGYPCPIFQNVTVVNNRSSVSGGGIYLSGSRPVFDSISRCNVYMNIAQFGNDLYSTSPITVVLDTFTVAKPREYHAAPLANFSFDILHGKVEQTEADVYVSPDGNDNNTGLTPDNPLKTIGQAFPRLIADSLHPRTIHLLEGRYSPSTTFEKFPVCLPNNISLAGLNDKNVIVDAEGTGRVFQFENNATSRLSGITITGGSNSGVYCSNSSPVLENLLITGNSGSVSGGGMFLDYNSRPTLRNVTVTNNTASGQGGGMYFGWDCNPVFDSISRCNIYLNTARNGNDLYSYYPINIIVDTFTVAKPREYHAAPLNNFTFDILHGKYAQADADLYVSPVGDNRNTGLTPDDPLKTVGQALLMITADDLHPRTIHLLKGRYSPSATLEKFPIVLPDNISLSGENRTSVIMDAEGSGSVFQFENNATSRLSGITITGGSNSGVYCSNSSPILENLTIAGNSGSSGGGIFCAYNNGRPVLKNVTIANNTASQLGGGIYCDGAVPVFDKNSRCNIYLNNAPAGNDLFSYSRIDVIVDTFSVLKPQAYHASELSNFSFDILHGKVAQVNADVYVSPDGDNSNTGLTPDDPLKTIGHVYSIIIADKQHPRTIHLLNGRYSPSTNLEKFPIILPDYISLAGVSKTHVIVDAEGTGSVFQFVGNNTPAHLSGITITGGSDGGVSCTSSRPVLENLIISGNSAGSGGGISCYGSRPTLRNVTISNNTASQSGGGIYCDGSVPVFDSNNRCNIYLNSAREGNDLYSNYSLIKVIVDTFTVLKPNAYHALPLSNFAFDILQGKIEQANADVYVSPSGDNSHSGLTPADPLKTIQQAFSILVADNLNPRTIHLLEGTYSPSSNKEFFPVVLPDYISLKGVNSTSVILDAESTAGVFQFTDSNSSHLSGITITGGSQGGIHCNNSSPILENLIISGNSAYTGGGISCIFSRPTLKNVTITNNTATQSGGGMNFDGSFPVFDSINRCNIYYNTAGAGNDLYSNSSLIKIIVDTFTVLHPQSWHAFPLPNFTFDILHGKVVQAGADLYVSPDGDNGNTGLSPDDPLKNICQAYPIIWADSLHPRTIHLLEGTYSPTTTDEKFPVILPDYISLEGGNDTKVIVDAEGTGSVFLFDNNTSSSLSGITITGGYVGVYCNNSSPVIENVTITKNQNSNYWSSGGGIACYTSNPFIKNSIISGNSASSGGGIYSDNSSPALQNVTVANNTASQFGGGMYFNQSVPVFDPINRCNIYLNSAPQGNDLYSNSLIDVILDTFTVLKPQALHSFPRKNFTFDILHGKVKQAEADVYVSPDGDNGNDGLTPGNPLKTINQAQYILAVDSLHPRTIHLLKGKYSPSATEEKFPVALSDYFNLAGINKTDVIVDAEGSGTVFQFDDNNTSRLTGITITGGSNGGVRCNHSSPVLDNVTIDHNGVLDYTGGGMACYASSPILKNSIISNNSSWSGGGLYCADHSSPLLLNVLLTGNKAANGGGMYTTYSGPVMKNVTLTKNTASESGGGIYFSDSSRVAFDSINRCNIYFNHAPAGSDLYAVSHTDVILDTFSVLRPVKKYAQTLMNFSFDILHGKIPQVDADVYVSPGGDNNNSGLSINRSFRTIQYAAKVIFADNLNPRTIHLAAGTYGPSFSGDTLPLVLPDYVSLKGSDKNTVRLDAGGASCAIRMEGNRSSPVSGLTVTGADSAGIYIINSATLLQNLIITNNSGTGLVCTGDNSRSRLEDVVISNNSGTYGGGMNISGISPAFRNVTVTDNVAMYGGGAYCSASVSDVAFSNNTARFGGGISISVFSSPTKPSFTNLVIDHNVAQDGGGIYVSSSSSYFKPYFKNLTCTENIAMNGGGIYSTGGGGSVIYSTILWNNEPEEVYLDNSYFSAHSSDVRGGVAGILSTNNSTIRWNAGNIDADPLLAGSGDHPYSLSAGSPCIDVGISLSGLNLPVLDILGNNRFWDGNGDGVARIDMGAYEFDPAWVGVQEPGILSSGIMVKSYPNPFTSATTIEFQTEESAEVSLTIYNNIGQPVAKLVSEFRPQGWQQVEWNAEGLPPGIYYFRLNAGDQAVTKRVIKL